MASLNNKIDSTPLQSSDDRDSDMISVISENQSVVNFSAVKRRSNRSLSNNLYYVLLLNHFGTEDILNANFLITIPSLITQLMQPEYFNIPESEVQTFNMLFISLYTAGYMSGGILNSFLGKNSRLSYLRIHLRLAIILTLFASLIHDKKTLLSMRFLQGLCVGILHPNNISEAFRITPKKLKAAVGNFFSFYLAVGIILGMVLIYLSNAGYYDWYWVLIALAGIEGLSIALNVFYLGVDLSFFEHLENGDEEKARKILMRFIKPSAAEKVLKEEKDFIRASREQKVKKIAILQYFREFLLAMAITSMLVVCFAFNYSSNLIIVSCEDPKSIEEAKTVSWITTVASIVELAGKAVQLFLPALNKRRKFNIISGFFVVGGMWVLMAYLYHSQKWYLIKIAIVPWFFFIGFFIFPAYFSILSDILLGEVMGIVLSLGKLGEILMQAVFSSILDYSDSVSTYRNLSIVFASIAILGGVLMSIFFFETNGKTKVEIHDILYNKKGKKIIEEEEDEE